MRTMTPVPPKAGGVRQSGAGKSGEVREGQNEKVQSPLKGGGWCRCVLALWLGPSGQNCKAM